MITLKELPGIPLGSELFWTGEEYRTRTTQSGAIHKFTREVVESNPEWFGQETQTEPQGEVIVAGIEELEPEVEEEQPKPKASKPKPKELKKKK